MTIKMRKRMTDKMNEGTFYRQSGLVKLNQKTNTNNYYYNYKNNKTH